MEYYNLQKIIESILYRDLLEASKKLANVGLEYSKALEKFIPLRDKAISAMRVHGDAEKLYRKNGLTDNKSAVETARVGLEDALKNIKEGEANLTELKARFNQYTTEYDDVTKKNAASNSGGQNSAIIESTQYRELMEASDKLKESYKTYINYLVDLDQKELRTHETLDEVYKKQKDHAYGGNDEATKRALDEAEQEYNKAVAAVKAFKLNGTNIFKDAEANTKAYNKVAGVATPTPMSEEASDTVDGDVTSKPSKSPTHTDAVSEVGGQSPAPVVGGSQSDPPNKDSNNPSNDEGESASGDPPQPALQ